MIDRGHHSLLGINIHAVDYEAATEKVITAARSDQPLGVSALAVHGVMTGVMDRSHRFRLNQLGLIVPDGQPVRWALNLLHGTKLRDRVYGPNLMLEVCRRCADENVGVYLFGGSEELLDALQTRLCERFCDLQVSGRRASKFRTLNEEERQDLIENIKKSGAKLVFVGLGCPRQEVFAYEMAHELNLPLLAVGAAFNFHAGELDQAPPMLQRWGLEWFYRFLKEPKRLWRRYVFLNPLYIVLTVLQLTRIWRIDPESGERPKEMIRYG